jgi:olfactory receptor
MNVFLFIFFGLSEGCLLAAMIFDQCITICSPLHYETRMSSGVFAQLAMISWGVGCVVSLGQTNYISSWISVAHVR